MEVTFEAKPDAAVEDSTVETVTVGELGGEEAAAKVVEPESEAKQQEAPSQSAVDGEHTCSECGMSFQRRYSLIMHTLKHEKARGYKCSVSVTLMSISVTQKTFDQGISPEHNSSKTEGFIVVYIDDYILQLLKATVSLLVFIVNLAVSHPFILTIPYR